MNGSACVFERNPGLIPGPSTDGTGRLSASVKANSDNSRAVIPSHDDKVYAGVRKRLTEIGSYTAAGGRMRVCEW